MKIKEYITSVIENFKYLPLNQIKRVCILRYKGRTSFNRGIQKKKDNWYFTSDYREKKYIKEYLSNPIEYIESGFMHMKKLSNIYKNPFDIYFNPDNHYKNFYDLENKISLSNKKEALK